MPENDIYNNKEKYEGFLRNLDLIAIPPEKRTDKNAKKSIYFCKNKTNLKYFRKLAEKFDTRDLSYVRRCRVMNTLRLISHAAKKEFSKCDRDDIDKIVAFMHTRYNSSKSKSDFIRDIKYIWKSLFPENDERGRIDETIMPYVVRHLKGVIDKSREKARKDKLTWEEFEKLVAYFSDEPKMQAYLTLAVESLGRPQEILYTKIEDLELYDNYAKLHISEHGKEGIGFLQCIDSYPYMMKWLSQHNLRNDNKAFLFINKINGQLTPKLINDLLKKACSDLKINKPITCYSLKRNGVTFSRLRGESDVEIQHKARWTSTKQLKTYDMSNQEDSFKMQLAKRGLIREDNFKDFIPKTKICPYCNYDKIGFTEDICPECLHIVNRERLKEDIKREENLNGFFDPSQIQQLFKLVYKLQKDVSEIKRE